MSAQVPRAKENQAVADILRSPWEDYTARRRNARMEKKRYIYWQDDDMWLGYLEAFS